MKQETLTKQKDKKIRVYLSDGRIYTGKIISVSDDVVELIDKFSLHVTISNDAIQHLELLNEGGEGENKKNEEEYLRIENQKADLQNRFETQYNIDFQDCVSKICNGNDQCFQCNSNTFKRYVFKKIIKNDTDYETCDYILNIDDCNYIKDKTVEQLKTETAI